MKRSRLPKILLAAALVLILIAGIVVVYGGADTANRTRITAYFANTNGLFVGDEVEILGVPVGKIDTIEPQPERAKVTFFVEDKYKVPANVNAVIMSPSLVPVRAIQLTPVYTGGPEMRDSAVIPQERTAVPVEFDDFRQQLQRLADTLQPTRPGGLSTLGRSSTPRRQPAGPGTQHPGHRHQAVAGILGAGRQGTDLFSTFKNLSILVSALQSSQACCDNSMGTWPR